MHSTSARATASVQSLSYTGTQLDVASVLKTVAPSVVTVKTVIQARGAFGEAVIGEAAGAGMVLSADGEILTNAHFVANSTSITVTLNGETTARKATLYGGQHATTFADIVVTASSKGHSAIGYRTANSGQVLVNPPKSAAMTLQRDDEVLVISPGLN